MWHVHSARTHFEVPPWVWHMYSRILFPTATTVKMSLRGTMVGVAHRMSCQLCIEAPHMQIEVSSLRTAEKVSVGNDQVTQDKNAKE